MGEKEGERYGEKGGVDRLEKEEEGKCEWGATETEKIPGYYITTSHALKMGGEESVKFPLRTIFTKTKNKRIEQSGFFERANKGIKRGGAA